jgi:outer membrane protein assembly factor BamB
MRAMASVDPPPPVRWKLWLWPVAVAVVLCAGGLVAIWSTERAQRQDHVVPTIEVAGATTILILLWSAVWLLALSRLRWRARIGWVAGGVLLIAAAAASIEFRGVNGDIVPVLGWRWGAAPSPVTASAAAPGPAPAIASTHDFPQYLGPHRDGTVPGVRLARTWAVAPRALWRRPVGPGWSGFAIAGGHAVTQEQRGDEELVACYDMASGAPRWTYARPTRWEDAIAGPGPRSTPTIHEGRVYALGGTGWLSVLDLGSGRRLWEVDVLADNGASPPEYGVAASPLVLPEAVVIPAGGTDGRSLAGYDPASGRRLWAGGDGDPAYASPRFAVVAGIPQVLVLNGDTVAAHDPASGRELWEFNWPTGQNAFQPLPLPGDRVFVSTGYGVGGKLLQVRVAGDGAFAVDLVWESLALKSKFANAVFRDGFLYGLDDGILVCLDGATGERRWKGGRYGHGQILLVGDLILVSGEDGTVALVEATPAEHRETARFAALDGKTWSPPALAGSRLIVRSDREAACFELPLASEG